MPFSLRDTRTFIMTSVIALSILQIEIFGTLGLVIYGLLIAYGIVFLAINFRKLNILTGPAFYIACAYYLYFILASVVNGGYTDFASPLLQFFILAIVAFSIRPVEEIRQDIMTIAKFMTVMGIIVAASSLLICLFTYYCPDALATLPSVVKDYFEVFTGSFPSRASGIMGNANMTGDFSFACFLFSMYLLVSQKNMKWIVACLINLALSAYLVFFLCASRTCMLGIACAVICFVVFYSYSVVRTYGEAQRKRFFTVLAVFCVVAVLLIVICFCVPSIRNFLLDRVIRIDSLNTGSGRIEVFQKSIELGEGHRIFGYNIGEELRLVTSSKAPHAHNIFLEALAAGGVPTLVLFCVLLIYSGLISLKNCFGKDLRFDDRVLFGFILTFYVAYVVCGMTAALINRMRISIVCFQLMLGYVHVINYQLKKQEKLN